MAFKPTIPSPEGNPFVSVTTLPEGTLFIIFGAILLGLFVIVVCWRVWSLWAAHRAASNNEARFTALDHAYGGPFVDPVAELKDDDLEKDAPRLHPVGVPLNIGSKARTKKPRIKSQADRVREAQKQGRFFSPTVEVLTHGAALPSGANSNRTSFLPSGYYSQAASSLMSTVMPQQGPADGSMPPHPRLSVQQTGRNSMMQHSTMSTDTLSTSAYPMSGQQPPQQQQHPLQSQQATTTRTKKLRPPSAYLDDLIGK